MARCDEVLRSISRVCPGVRQRTRWRATEARRFYRFPEPNIDRSRSAERLEEPDRQYVHRTAAIQPEDRCLAASAFDGSEAIGPESAAAADPAWYLQHGGTNRVVSWQPERHDLDGLRDCRAMSVAEGSLLPLPDHCRVSYGQRPRGDVVAALTRAFEPITRLAVEGRISRAGAHEKLLTAVVGLTRPTWLSRNTWIPSLRHRALSLWISNSRVPIA